MVSLTLQNNEILTQRLSELPQKLREDLVNNVITDIATSIKESHSLNDTQVVALENELTLIFLGFETLGDLQKNIEKELGTPTEKAIQLSATILDHLPQDTLTILQEIEQIRNQPLKNISEQSSLNTLNVPKGETNLPTPDASVPVTGTHDEHTPPSPTQFSPQTVQKTPEIITPATTERPSTLTKTRTMQQDIHAINRTEGSQVSPTPDTQSAVPRYAKPLTDTPKYD